MRFANLHPTTQSNVTRRRTAIRAVVLGLLAFGLLTVSSGARAATGLIDDTTYESPNYGYEVTWGESWIADPNLTNSNRGADMLALVAPGGSLFVLSLPANLTPDELIDTYVEGLEKSGIDGLEFVERGEADGVTFATVTGDHAQDGALVIYFEARSLVEPAAGIPIQTLTVLASRDAAFTTNLAVTAEVEVDHDPAFLATADDGQDRDARDEPEENDRGGRDRVLADPEDDDRQDAGDEDDVDERQGSEVPRFALAVARNLA